MNDANDPRTDRTISSSFLFLLLRSTVNWRWARILPTMVDSGKPIMHTNCTNTIMAKSRSSPEWKISPTNNYCSFHLAMYVKEWDWSQDIFQLICVSLQLWCETQTTIATKWALQDSHCPGSIRLRGVLENSPEFRKTFACRSDAKMYTKNQCRIWWSEGETIF